MRTYNSIQREIIKLKLKDINDNKLLTTIFIILKEDENFNYSKKYNNNGIYFNINNLLDNTIEQLKNFLHDNNKNQNEKIIYKPYIDTSNNTDINIKQHNMKNLLKINI